MTLDPIEERLARYNLAGPPPGLKDDIIEGVMRRVARRRTIGVLTVVLAALLVPGAIVVMRPSLLKRQPHTGQYVVASAIAGGGGSIDKDVFRDAEVICTGAVTATRPVDVVAPLWRQWIYADDLVTYQADFVVDRVVKGASVAPGQTIHIQYPLSKLPDHGGSWSGHIGFGDMVGHRRCMVCLIQDWRGKDTYVICYERGYCLMAKKPEVEGWDKLTPEQRIGTEFAAAIRDNTIESPSERPKMGPLGDWFPGERVGKAVCYGAMVSAGQTRVSTPELISALRARESDADASIASRAITALLQLNDMRTIYALPDALAAQ